ncbi:MAG: DEAD/DEAH box helicase family protein [Bacteroidota bacterium]|nr:DEAD/DEAH box helicase family protein [Bacteroidota bacterium]
MSNFQFLHKEWSDIFEIAKEAEDMVNNRPLASRMFCRQALEKGIYWMYDNDSRLEIPDINTLGSLITAKCIKPLLDKAKRRGLLMLRDIGNAGVHGRDLKSDEADMVQRFGPLEDINVNSNKDLAQVSIRLLFEFCSFLFVSYSEDKVQTPIFKPELIPNKDKTKETSNELEQLQKEFEKQLKKDEATRKQLEEQKEELQKRNKLLAERAKSRENQTKHIPQLIPESVTRKLYIDVLLKEAGWNKLTEGKEIEYEVTGMPTNTNPSGIGYVDYVLWGDDGNPLAVVEAKKTMTNPKKGKQQALLYANCLEQMSGQRPIIFYTNGFETFIWDDKFYHEREISGFYTKDELQLLINRRESRKDLRNFKVDLNIAGRAYQIEAIKRVAENLGETHSGNYVGTKRKSLLVMATGSGKTRTASAIVDMLTKCNWVKRVLFLADRNALVTQAKNAFKEHLEHLSSIDLTKEREDNTTRLVFSTYPTIINKIDNIRNDKGRFYGVGHFDLIIIDEAHRSVYNKYKSIFEYFDSLLIGLTATPKKDIDRNTYSLFGIEDDDPTFAYELEKAVKEKFLVPPKALSVPLKFQREGIKYSELSELEKEEYEEKFGDPTSNEAPDFIGSDALNKWLFNKDTVDKVLDHLMNEGIKVSGGDKLGKTIIFAKNHNHAEFIENRFNINYPEYSGHFLRVIDNYESKAQDLLEKFTDNYQEQNPQIAVSVDMMDTGIDAPRVVNLVFFKIVRSSSKFWQMIGRGTRLCPNLFAPNEDKKEFLIFDYCENFEFFEHHPEGAKRKNIKPLQQQIFEAKLKISHIIGNLEEKTDADQKLKETYINQLHQIIYDLDDQRFQVRKELRHVNEYRDLNRWQNVSKNDIIEINTHLSHLEPPNEDDELAKRFDLLILTFQIILLNKSDLGTKFKEKIFLTAKALQKKDTIPQVSAKLPFIKELQTNAYWENIDSPKLDILRLKLRDLIKYLDTMNQEDVYTNFEDLISYQNIKENTLFSADDFVPYKQRVESYIKQNEDHLTIYKLKNNIPITKDEINAIEEMLFSENIAGTKEKFQEEFGNKPLGQFIRSIVGMEKRSLEQVFANFLQTGNLTADQITFVNTVINYLTKNGSIDKSMLYESPFTDQNDQGIDGVFEIQKKEKVVSIIDQINFNAIA